MPANSPFGLPPMQVKVLPVSEKSMEYAESVYDALRAASVRCELDRRSEKIGYMIREAQAVDRVPLYAYHRAAGNGKRHRIGAQPRHGRNQNHVLGRFPQPYPRRDCPAHLTVQSDIRMIFANALQRNI